MPEATPPIAPSVDKDGVPHCSYELCPQYDGKRCRATGFRPHGACEPAIVELRSELGQLTKERDRMRSVFVAASTWRDERHPDARSFSRAVDDIDAPLVGEVDNARFDLAAEADERVLAELRKLPEKP